MGRGRGRGSATERQGSRDGTQARQPKIPQRQHNPRRALGDIGNLVGPITTGGGAPKNESVPETQSDPMHNPAPVDRPVTRGYDETLAGNRHLTQVDGKHDENGYRRKKQRKSQSRRPSHEVHESAESLQVFPEPMQVCGNTNEIMTRSRTALLREENQSLARQSQTALLRVKNQSLATQDETSVPDIDKANVENPIYVTDYVQDIYLYYRQAEMMNSVQEDYLSRQSEVNLRMRSILIDWLIEVHQTFELRHETLFLAVNVIDRYLSSQDVLRKDFQLVGLTAMLLACKFLKAANADDKLEAAAFFLMELALVEYDMLMYSASMVAAAAVYTARCTLRKHPSWDPTLEYHTKHTEASLKECAKCMVGLHERANYDSQINYVHKKYSSPRLYIVANLSPALFIRNT